MNPQAPAPDRPMTILLLSFEYPPETGFGGIGTYTAVHAHALARLGHQVHVLAGTLHPTPLVTTRDGDIHVHRIHASGLVMRLAALAGALGCHWTRRRLETARSMAIGVRLLAAQHRFDVIEMPECGAEGALLPRRATAPTVVRFHSPAGLIMRFYPTSRLDRLLAAWLEQRAIRRATALTACSHFLAEAVRDQLHVQAPITVLANGIDVYGSDATSQPVPIPSDPGTVTILFAARMEPRKGIALCLPLCLQLLRHPHVRFVFAGEDLFGHVAHTILPALTRAGLAAQVRVTGRLPREALRALAASVDIVFLPALWENCPYACLEAMAAGRAIVASSHGGLPELLTDGINGLLAPPGDVPAFLLQLERLIASPALRHQLGAAAQATVHERFDDLTLAARTVALYRSLPVSGPPSPRIALTPPRPPGRERTVARKLPLQFPASPTLIPSPFPQDPEVARVSVFRSTLSIIIPASNAAAHLEQCLLALGRSDVQPSELIVIDDGSTDRTAAVAEQFGALVLHTGQRRGPAFARNLGARSARGDLLFFLDADVCVRPDTIESVLLSFERDPGLDALIGSYDASPGAPDFLSQYRNLMHAYVHQRGAACASTFWSGCGAIRRPVFEQHCGFREDYRRPAIEDIELGYRLIRAGHRIHLDRSLVVTHLKRWTFWSLVRTDMLDRGIPWTELVLRDRFMPNDLNLELSQRVSVALVFLLVGFTACLALRPHAFIIAPLLAILFLLLARWWGELGTYQRPRHAFAVILGLVVLIAARAWSHRMFGLIPPLMMTPVLLLMRHRYSRQGKMRPHHRIAGMLYLCASVVVAALYLPAQGLALTCFALLALLALINSQFYIFLAGKRGIPFLLAAIPFHLLYHFYNGLSFIAGVARFYSSAAVATVRRSFLQPARPVRPISTRPISTRLRKTTYSE